MLKITKAPEPDFFLSFKKKITPQTWKDLDKELSKKLKKYLCEKEQRPNNESLCVYCERKIMDSNSHIEHIKPQSKFPSDIFSYENLTASCDNLSTCGKHKGGNWDEKFINPVKDDPEAFFKYLTNGEIISIKTDDDRVQYTIGLLNLNTDKLKSCRRTIILKLNNYSNEYIQDIGNFFNEFPSLIKYYQDHFNNS